MSPSVDTVQFHADKFSAPASYFSCCCCWSLSDDRVLYHFLFFLFCLRVLLLWTFYFSLFHQSIPIFIEWNSIIIILLVICFRPFHSNDFVFLVSPISLIVVTCFCFCWTSNHTVVIGRLKLLNPLKSQDQKIIHLWIDY